MTLDEQLLKEAIKHKGTDLGGLLQYAATTIEILEKKIETLTHKEGVYLINRPNDYFKKLGKGSLKKLSIDTGYSYAFLSTVITGKKKCSKFAARCISDWSNGELSENDFLIGKGAS